MEIKKIRRSVVYDSICADQIIYNAATRTSVPRMSKNVVRFLEFDMKTTSNQVGLMSWLTSD
jgi:hypothetical protein